MRLRVLLVFYLLFGVFSSHAVAQDLRDCKFKFEVDTQTSAFNSLTIDGERKLGFWLSINRAPADVRAFAKHIGLLRVCLRTPDGKPRSIQRGNRTIKLESPFTTRCTAALLPGNRLLTNAHCFYALEQAGFSIVSEARIDFNYTSKDDTGAVQTYPVTTRELAVDKDLDAMVLQVLGGDANADLGGHIPMKMMSEVEPFQELRMIHHPGGTPQQYSSGTCQVHRRQTEIPDARSPFRHTCESIGGSSGSLLLDSRTLSVVALHNQGGLKPSGDNFNSGHKIGKIEAALNLGFEEFELPEDASDAASLALTDALLQFEPKEKAQALHNLIAEFPGTLEAKKAKIALKQIPNTSNDVVQSAAEKAFSEALMESDPFARLTALRSVAIDFVGTPSAEEALSVIAQLELDPAKNITVEKTETVNKATPVDPELLAAIEACDNALSSKGKVTEHGFVSTSYGSRVIPELASPWNQPVPMECVQSAMNAPQHPRAARLYGFAVWDHEGTRGNEGRYWLRLAASNGDTLAKGQLGLMLFGGFGGRKDESRGLALLKEASDDGDGLASTTLGNHFYKTDGAAARRYFERGSRQGESGSDFFLAMHYLKKESDYSLDKAEFDLFLAEHYLERAKAGGNGFAFRESAWINLGSRGSDLLLLKNGHSDPWQATDAELADAIQQAARTAANDVYSAIENPGTLDFILALRPETLGVADWRDYYLPEKIRNKKRARANECNTMSDSFGNSSECPANEFDKEREKLIVFWSELQTLLKEDGFYKGKIDGDFGAGSRAALQRIHQAKQQQPRKGIDPINLAFEDNPIVSQCIRLSSGYISDDVNAYRACSISSDRYIDQSRVVMGMGDALAAIARNKDGDTENRVWALNSAREAYQKGLRLNHPRAAVELAMLPETPNSGPRNASDLKSVERAWLRQAANDGNGRAMLLLAEASDTGKGIPRDALIAAQLIVSALEMSEPRAIELLTNVSVETRVEVQKLMTTQSTYSGPSDGQIDTNFLKIAHDFCGC